MDDNVWNVIPSVSLVFLCLKDECDSL